MTTTIDTLLAALTANCPARLRSLSAQWCAQCIARDILAPVVPAGTLRWLASPADGESLRAYARRAYTTAAARASWAGGLTDGTRVYDDAVVASVATLVRM